MPSGSQASGFLALGQSLGRRAGIEIGSPEPVCHRLAVTQHRCSKHDVMPASTSQLLPSPFSYCTFLTKIRILPVLRALYSYSYDAASHPPKVQTNLILPTVIPILPLTTYEYPELNFPNPVNLRSVPQFSLLSTLLSCPALHPSDRFYHCAPCQNINNLNNLTLQPSAGSGVTPEPPPTASSSMLPPSHTAIHCI